MKRLLGMLIALVLVAAFATPTAAQGPGRSENVCFGGTRLVTARENPNSVILFGCGGRIQSEAQVRQDVISFGCDVVVESGARIGHDVVVFGGDLTIESGAVVGHDVVVFGAQPNIRDGAIINGRVTAGGPAFNGFRGFGSPGFFYNGISFWSGMAASFVRGLLYAIALAALGALVLVFLPTQTQQVAATAERAALPSLGVGCLTFLVAPTLGILFIFTCLGIPLAVILFVALFAAIVFGWIAVGMVLGDRLVRAARPGPVVPLLAMLIGLFVLWLITAFPFLGGVIGIFVASLAVGAVVLTRFGTKPYPLPYSPITPIPTAPPPAIPPMAPPPAPPVPPVPPVPPATPAPPAAPDAPIDPSI